MKFNKTAILALLVALSIFAVPVSAATTWDVNSTMNSSQIQDIIDNDADVGDTINFTTATGTIYNGISLTATHNNLKFKGNGVTLIGNGVNHVLTITGTTGTKIKGFTININGTAGDGIRGSNVNSAVIEKNTIKNGGDGINIFMTYSNLTIKNNVIKNMIANFGDAISLVSHTLETATSTTIKGNTIKNTIFGIFLGGNFNGNITGNKITNTTVGLQTTGRPGAGDGILIADIKYNIIPGILMENPNVQYLNLYKNKLGQLNNTGFSILTNNFGVDPFGHDIIVNFNYIGYNVTEAFINATTEAHNNTGSGAYSVPP